MNALLSAIVLAAMVQGVLLGTLYSFSRVRRGTASLLLGLFLYTLVFEAITIFVPATAIWGYPISGYFTTPEVKLFFPLFFLHFVLVKVGRSKAYRRFLAVHYMAACAVLILTLANLGLHLVAGKSLAQLVRFSTLEMFFLTQQSYAFLLTAIAVVLATRETTSFREVARSEYADYDLLSIRWLWQFIGVMVAVVFLWGAELVRIFAGGQGGSNFVFAGWGFLVLLIYLVSYNAFQHPNLVTTERAAIALSGQRRGTSPTGVRSQGGSLPAAELQRRMSEGQYYRNQALTIHELAKELRVSSRSITSCLNQELGVNFTDWVNGYRVTDAKRMLGDTEFHHLSIEGIGVEAGFNSRSALYTAFRRHTGYPPGHFKRPSETTPDLS